MKVYHRKKEMSRENGFSREIREGIAEFFGILAIANEAAVFYGIGAVAICGCAVPGWLPASIAAGIVTVLGAAAHAAWKLMDGKDCLRRFRCRRHGVITAEEICRALRGGRA